MINKLNSEEYDVFL